MSSLPDKDNLMVCDNVNDSLNCSNDPSFAVIMQKISQEQNATVNLDTICQTMMNRFRSASPSTSLSDKISLNFLPTATKLFIESFDETEKSLSTNSTETMKSTLTLWNNSLEPWQDFLQHVKTIGPVQPESIKNLLDSVPRIIQKIFHYCKESMDLYAGQLNCLLPKLTGLFNKTKIIFNSFCSIIENSLNFDDPNGDLNVVTTLLDVICDTVMLTHGLDMKTWLNAWKNFVHLAHVHEKLIKKSNTTECITRRYADMAKAIPTVLHDSFRNNKETNHERDIKCAGLLLKMLIKLCTVYRGCCGKKDSEALVQLLVKLQRYCPPFPRQRLAEKNVKITESSNNHIVQPITELLKILGNEKSFIEAFFVYEKSMNEEPIHYHLLVLRVMKELVTRQQCAIPLWLGNNGNIIDTALASSNDCCADHLINDIRIPILSEIDSGELQHQDVYQVTLRLLCHLVALSSNEQFSMIEVTLLRHLLSGEFWSSLMSCDLWTFLGRIVPSELCQDHLDFLVDVLQYLFTRYNSFEFTMLSSLIGRLYKLLPDRMKESVFGKLEELSYVQLVEPFKDSLTAKSKDHLWSRAHPDGTNDLWVVDTNLRLRATLSHWEQLIAVVSSIGAIGDPTDARAMPSLTILASNLVATTISKAQGITREMLIELIDLLLDCTKIERTVPVDCPDEDWDMAGIYDNMTRMIDHVPTELRLKMIVFLRENLNSHNKANGKRTLEAKTKLFCALANNGNPWVRQESFETYAEQALNCPNVELFDSLSVGISKFSDLSRQMSSYFSNELIHNFTRYSSLADYLNHLALASKNVGCTHKCYEADYRRRDDKLARIERQSVDDRLRKICDELKSFVIRKHEIDPGIIFRLKKVVVMLLDSRSHGLTMD